MKKLKVLTATVIMAVVLAACGGNQSAETTAAPETEAQTTAEATEADAEEETEAVIQTEEAAGQIFDMLQGVVQDLSDDGSSFSFLCDDGVTREISVSDIGDVEVDLADGVQIAIGCIGKITDDLSGVTLVVALPEQEEWTIKTSTGVTTNNAMSAFGIDADDSGDNIQFLKDNCPIVDHALSQDEGDYITVTYVISAEGNFPLMIEPAG